MRTICTTTEVEDDEDILITTRKSSGWIMHFRPLGVVNYRQPESIDALEYICGFTKGELFLLKQVYGHIDDNNRLTLRPKSYAPAEWAKLKKAIPLWRKKGLLVRLKREYYMINPWFLIPAKQEQVKATDYWKALKQKY